jgi:hypothetical protein
MGTNNIYALKDGDERMAADPDDIRGLRHVSGWREYRVAELVNASEAH